MPTRRLKVQLVTLLGLCTAFYALNVESQLDDPFYEPACSGVFGGNCGKVFKSEYAHILSAWGVVPKGHPLDLSLASSGLLMYTGYLVAISIKGPWPFREQLFLAATICAHPYKPQSPQSPSDTLLTPVAPVAAGACFSCYLLYVIKVILKEFCIVCFTFHCCNFSLLILAVLEYRNPEHVKPKSK